jgi:hypothetical protein
MREGCTTPQEEYVGEARAYRKSRSQGSSSTMIMMKKLGDWPGGTISVLSDYRGHDGSGGEHGETISRVSTKASRTPTMPRDGVTHSILTTE